tara:strand:+ start:6117 stop:7121 length:1005 start_codon:yes stop_codon:yes gene_type:complete
MSYETRVDVYNTILNKLNENSINFIIIRGFDFLPTKPYTDIDIIINPKHYNIFLDLIKELFKKEIIEKGREKVYYCGKKKYICLPFFTHKKILPVNTYKFNAYSDLFFFEDENKAFIGNVLFKNYLFKNKEKINNYFIPNSVSEIILLIFINIFNKNRKWEDKDKNRIFELIKHIDVEQFNYIKNLFYKDDILNLLKNNNFELIDKPNINLGMFIIRKNGLKKDIINFVLDKLKQSNFRILDLINIGFHDEKKFLKKFYNNYEINEEDILNCNGNKCLCIIVEFRNGIRFIKIGIRRTFGNIIHASDSSHDCERELTILLDENINTFKGVGNHY